MEFALYVTPRRGATVPRFGAPRGTYIGARRVGKQLEWDEERIVAIPVEEYRRYRAEYEGAIADGSLKKHDADAYKAQQEKRKAANAEAKKKAAGATAKQAEAKQTADAVDPNADTEPANAQRIRAVTEPAATIPPPADANRPKPLLLGGKDER
jgi:membrane protein involved in colicin uptake